MLRINSLVITALICISAYASHLEDNTFKINIGLTGSWYTPEFPGQGFLIDVITPRDENIVTWFPYKAKDDDGASITLVLTPAYPSNCLMSVH